MSEVIEASNLILSYKPNEPIIKNASIKINSNEFVFITGKSGSGKSTLIKSLYGALRPAGGKLTVCGVDMNQATSSKLKFLRKHLGVVFQDYKLIAEWTVEKNVMLPLMIGGFSKNICKAQAKKLLKHVNMSQKIHHFPIELSGGEQQRVAMARALAHNPVVILADEPTGNLDDYSSELIWDLLKSARKHLGTTIVAVTHKIPATIATDYKHYFLDEGKLHEVN